MKFIDAQDEQSQIEFKDNMSFSGMEEIRIQNQSKFECRRRRSGNEVKKRKQPAQI